MLQWASANLENASRSLVGFLLGVGFLVVWVSGCRTAQGLDPSVDLGGYDTIVVQDFAFEEGELGSDFADQLAAAVEKSGVFREVRRDDPTAESLVLKGVIRHYDPGNVAARMKAGRGTGEARLAGVVSLVAGESGESLGEVRFDESTLYFGPDARRTGRETGDWLQGQVIDSIVDALRQARGQR